MNKPLQPPAADPDIGPLDEHGQQIWSPEEAAAIARLGEDPDYRAGIKEAEAQFERGEWLTHEEVVARSGEQRRRWFAERGMPYDGGPAV